MPTGRYPKGGPAVNTRSSVTERATESESGCSCQTFLSGYGQTTNRTNTRAGTTNTRRKAGLDRAAVRNERRVQTQHTLNGWTGLFDGNGRRLCDVDEKRRDETSAELRWLRARVRLRMHCRSHTYTDARANRPTGNRTRYYYIIL